MDVGRHDPDLALSGGDDPGTVGSDQTSIWKTIQVGAHPEHVEDGYTFRDTDDQLDPRLRRLRDRFRGESGWDHDHAGIRAGRGHGILYCIEDRSIQVACAAASRRHPAAPP